MKEIALVILAILAIGLIAGCTQTAAPNPEEQGGADTVATEAGDAVDTTLMNDTEDVEIGEMI